jgi:acetyl-CoA carboxylase carboxyltransferase component
MSNDTPPHSPGATRQAFDDFIARRDALTDAARAKAIARQHALGKLSARERIALLVDPGSFHEIGALVEPKRDTSTPSRCKRPSTA